MPPPLTRPTGIGGIRRIGGGGLLRSQNPIDTYLPNQQEVEAAGQQIAQEDEPNFFFKLLQIPNRLLFGQSIQGFFEGVGEEGVGEGLRKAFINNPLNQIIEGVGLGDEVGNLFEAVGLKEEGSAGLVEDTSFAKVRESFGWDAPENAAAEFALNLAGELLTSPLELFFTPFGYTSKGWKAALAAKAEGLPAIGVKGAQISPDLAKATEAGMKAMMAFKVPFTDAGFAFPLPKNLDLYSARLIQSAKDFVNKSPLISPVLQLFKRDQVAASSAEVRFQGAKAVTEGDKAKYGLEATAYPHFQQVMSQTPEAVKHSTDFNRLAILMQEFGIEGVEDYADMLALVQTKILTREGDDILRVEERLSRAAGIDTRGLGPDDLTTTTGKRSAISQETKSPRELSKESFVAETLPELFQRLQAVDNADDLFDATKNMAVGLKKLGDTLAGIEGTTRMLNSALEGYFPRDLTPALKEAIDARASKFMEGRKITDMSTLEVNHYLMENGTKLLGFKSVEDVANNLDEENYWKLVKALFPEDWIKGLKERFGAEANGITEFFNTNNSHAWYTRIQKSARLQQNKAMMSTLLEEGSPVIHREMKLEEVVTNPALLDDIRRSDEVPMIVSGEGNVVFKGNRATGEMISATGKLNTRAAAAVADQQVDDWLLSTRREGRKIWTEEIDDLEKAGGIRVREKESLKVPIEDSKTLTEIRNKAERISIMEADLAALDKSQLADHPLAKITREQIDYLKSWDEKAIDVLPADRRAIVQGTDEEFHASIAAEIAENESRLEVISRELGHLREMRKTTKNPQFAERIERLTGLRDQLQTNISASKAAGKSRQGLVKKYRDEGIRKRQLQYDDLKRRESEIRQGIQNSIDAAKKDYGEFRNAVYGQTLEKQKSLRLVRDEALREMDQSTDFDDLFHLWRNFKKNGIAAVDDLRATDAALYEKFTEKFKDMRVVTMDSENYAAFLDPKKGLFARLNKPESASRLLSVFDDATSLWKTFTLNPLFLATRARDVASNVVMQIQGGARPQFRSLGNKFIKSLDEFLKTGDMASLKAADVPADILKAAGVADGEELMRVMYEQGVVSPNLFLERYTVGVGDKAIDLSRNVPFNELNTVGKKVSEAMARASLVRTPFGKWGARLAEKLDADTRIGAFFDHLRQGKGVDEAAATVRKWGYDPRRVPLSNFERNTLRRFIPFYSFSKTAVNMQLEAFLTKPATVTWFKKVHDAGNVMNGMSETEQEAYLPEFVRDAFGVPIEQEGGQAKVFMMGSLIPIGSVGDIANAFMASFDDESPDGFANYIGKQLNPLIKVSIENLRNESFYTQRELERYEGEQVEYLGISMSPKTKNVLMNIRLLNEIDNLGVFTPGDVDTILAERRGAEPKSFFERLLRDSSFSPLSPVAKTYTVDLERQADYSIRKEKAKLSREKSDMGRALKDPNAKISAANVEALKKAIAVRQARLQMLQEGTKRFQP